MTLVSKPFGTQKFVELLKAVVCWLVKALEDPPDSFGAVHYWHVEVHDDKVEVALRVFADGFNTLEPVVGEMHLEVRTKSHLEHFQYDFVVVHEQEFWMLPNYEFSFSVRALLLGKLVKFEYLVADIDN